MRLQLSAPCNRLKPFVRHFVVSEAEEAQSYPVLPDTALVMGFDIAQSIAETEEHLAEAMDDIGRLHVVEDFLLAHLSPPQVKREPGFAPQAIASPADADALMRAIRNHQLGGSDFPAICRQAAKAGVEKWAIDMWAMTCTYFDLAGNKMLVEPIPAAADNS